MTTPVLKKEYLDMIPDFSGEPTLLNRFVSVCDKLVAKFYVAANPEDFQNEYLFSTILTKIKSPALELVTSANSYGWPDVRKVLVSSYLDKRDCFTLNLEMAELKQESSETPFNFYERIQKLLNLQVAFFINKEPASSVILCEYAKKLALRVLLRGLHEPIGSLMRTKNPSDLGEALSMLTNDFQFKMSKLTTPLARKHIVQTTTKDQSSLNLGHQYPYRMRNPSFNQNHVPFNQMGGNHFYRNPNSLHRPQFMNTGQTQQNQGYRPAVINNNIPRPQVSQPKPYQPTPMSISTRNTGEAVKRPKFNQMTGRNIDNEQAENTFFESYQAVEQNLDLNSQFEDMSLIDPQSNQYSVENCEQDFVDTQIEENNFLV